MTEPIEIELGGEILSEVGRRVEANIGNNEGVFLSAEDAISIKESVQAD